MKRIKFVALFFSISIIFLGYFLSVQAENNLSSLLKINQNLQFSTASKIVPKLDLSETYFYEQKGDYESIINSLFLIINNLKEQIIKIQSSINSKNTTDSLKQKIPTLFQDKNIFSTSKNEDLIFTVDDYYIKFNSDVAKKVFFSKEERDAMKKGEESGGERILRLEELMQKAANGYNLSELKDSFLAWYNFDQKVIIKMKKLPVSGEAAFLNNNLISWFKFHSDMAKKFSDGDLSISQANSLYEQFKNKGAAQNLFMKDSTAKIKNSKNFSFVNSAQALTCKPDGRNYYFGGSVSKVYYCNDGTAMMVAKPCGGILHLSYVIEALNPYFTGFLKVSDNVLGKATITPGICILGIATQTTYEADIVFYGASGGL